MKGVMKEYLLEWELNGIPQSPLLCSGEDQKALLIGHMITSGRIDPSSRWCIDGSEEKCWQISTDSPVRKVGSAFEALDSMGPIPSDRKAEPSELSELCDELMGQEHLVGLHAVLLSDGEQQVIGRDIGRHNALDKAVGTALMENMDLSRTVLCTTARLTLETLVRAARAGIPVLATCKPVGSLCVEWAEKWDVAVCRAGSKSICYSASWRMI